MNIILNSKSLFHNTKGIYFGSSKGNRRRTRKSAWHNLKVEIAHSNDDFWPSLTSSSMFYMFREHQWVAGDLEPAECSPLHPHLSHAHWLRECRACVSTYRSLSYSSADFLSVRTRGFSYISWAPFLVMINFVCITHTFSIYQNKLTNRLPNLIWSKRLIKF